MRIGSLRLENRTIFAPLAGISNLPLRLLAKEAGCALVCSEMISANGLVRGARKTLQLLDSRPQERPLSVQIFGSDPEVMAAAAEIAAAAGADVVDINFGCAVKKVLKTGAGAALMQNPGRAEAVLKAVRRAISIPLTIKIRSGWRPGGADALQIAEIAQACGVDAVTVHPRTATQGFRGKADWSLIAAVKRHVSIPVIGNGDITSAEDAHRMIAQTGCDAVMIGRHAIGNPWIFTQVRARLEGGPVQAADPGRRFAIMRRYLDYAVAYFGEERACRMMRSRLGWFVKGLPGSSRFRRSIQQVASRCQALELIEAYRQKIDDRG